MNVQAKQGELRCFRGKGPFKCIKPGSSTEGGIWHEFVDGKWKVLSDYTLCCQLDKFGVNMNKIQNEVNKILEGAGWASDEYILNTPCLSEQEKFELMRSLARHKKLYCEEEIEDKLADREPKKGRMTEADVVKAYSNLND